MKKLLGLLFGLWLATSPVQGQMVIGGASCTGACTMSSLALGGATIGSNALAVTGTANISGALTLGTSGILVGGTNLIEQRNGTAAQRGKFFNTWTDASNGEWFDIDWITNANIATIGTNKNGTGATRALKFVAGGTAWLDVSTLGAATFANYVVATNGYYGQQIELNATGGYFIALRMTIKAPSDGVVTLSNYGVTDFTRLQFGGTTSSFPAIKRDGTGIAIRLADDSAAAPLTASTLTAGTSTAGPFSFNVNKNTGAIPSNPAAVGAEITSAFAQVDGTINRVGVFSAGTGIYSAISKFTSRGTLASPTASQNNDVLGVNFWYGYGASAYVPGAGFAVSATENWTNSATGARLEIYTSPTGSGITTAATFQASGGLSIGTTDNPGLGGLQVSGQQFNPTMAADTATPDSTVCKATTGGQLLRGTGALGICLGTSGQQFKTAFAPMAAGIDDLMKINFFNYRYKDGWGDNGARTQYGTTAQDVESALPDIARQDVNGQTINYDSGALLFIGLRAIQQLNAKIERLERIAR